MAVETGRAATAWPMALPVVAMAAPIMNPALINTVKKLVALAKSKSAAT